MKYIEELKELAKLKDDGILTEDEFQKKKYLDYQYPNGKKQIAPAIDHDHETGLIRGILSERVNQLTDQWHKWKAYGKLSEPIELIEYRKNPPAYECIGRVRFK